MFNSVLLPIDLTHHESWDKALPMALKLAGDTGELHILGIMHEIGSPMIAGYLPDGFEKEALNGLEKALETFAAEKLPAGARVKVHVGHGHVPETILSVAAKTAADLIIMSSHPPNELKTLLVGSNADKVVRHAPIPVLVVR